MEQDVINAIGGAYATASANWLSNLLPIAQGLFLSLAAIELCWSGIGWVMAERAGEAVLGRILKRVMTLAFFYGLILLAPSWMPVIIDSFAEAGLMASGQTSLDPGVILNLGINLAIEMFDDAAGLFTLLTMPLWVAASGLVVAVAFAVIAGTLLHTLIESYVVLGAGVLLLGFGGSRWTVSFAEGYLIHAVRVGVRLFVLFLLIGVGMSFPVLWLQALEQGAFSTRVALEIMGGSLVFAMTVWKVPQIADQMLGSRASFNLERAYVD